MPLLFYFPFIVWMGTMRVVQEEMLVPQPVHDPVKPKIATHRAVRWRIPTGCRQPSRFWWSSVISDFSVFGHRQQTRRNDELVKRELGPASERLSQKGSRAMTNDQPGNAGLIR